MAKKYKCDLCYSAEGEASGYMWLTRAEYLTVKRAINRYNWNNLSDEGWSGGLNIMCPELDKIERSVRNGSKDTCD